MSTEADARAMAEALWPGCIVRMDTRTRHELPEYCVVVAAPGLPERPSHKWRPTVAWAWNDAWYSLHMAVQTRIAELRREGDSTADARARLEALIIPVSLREDCP